MKKFIVSFILAVFLATPAFADAGDLFHVKSKAGQAVRIDSLSKIVGAKVDVEVVATSDTLTAAESGRTYIMKGGAAQTVTMTLPDAVAGLQYNFVATDAGVIYIDPNGTDIVNYLTMSAGDRLKNPSSPAVADSVTLIASDDTTWIVKSMFRVWQDGN